MESIQFCHVYSFSFFFFFSALRCCTERYCVFYTPPFLGHSWRNSHFSAIKTEFFSFTVCKSLRIDCVSVFMSSLFRSIMDRVFVFTTERTEHMNISLCRLLWYCIAMLSYAVVVVIAAVLKLMFTKRLCYGYLEPYPANRTFSPEPHA